MNKYFILLIFVFLSICGCDDTVAVSTATNKPQPAHEAKSLHAPIATAAKPERIVLRLPALWNATKSSVSHAMRGHKLTEDDEIQPDYPEPALIGGTIRSYDLGDGTEFCATFDATGHAKIVYVANLTRESGELGLRLEQWHQAFQRYGIGNWGNPSRTAERGYYWGPPRNKTGGYEIEIFADDTGQIWQVQLRTPEDEFLNRSDRERTDQLRNSS